VSHTAILVIAGAIAITVWWIDVRLHPIRRCPWCHGSKHNVGSGTRRWGTCPRCGGEGEVRRFGGGKD
jgi:DnaJ-class molecular chaperone